LWPRIIEAILGCWLVLAPFVLDYAATSPTAVRIDMAAGALLIATSLGSMAERFRYARFGTAALACGLIAVAYLTAGQPAGAPQQNEMITGLLVLMFSIIPNEANQPPRSWRGIPPEV
jgi:hypothetical protein